mmetsp:Transcript_13708/g.31624  ORF Transcript_13708/g.31624 Transcript_13708/m.31624 type:complete len:219 (-) Transcript_13708:2931-3587(-)
MEKALQGVLEDPRSSQTDSHRLDGLEHRIDYVRRLFENVWPHEVEKMSQRIFATKSINTQSKVLDHCAGSLSVHQVTIHERIFQQGSHSIDIILAHLSDVLEKEGQCLENSVLDIELRQTIFIQQRWEDSEGPTSLRNNSDCNRCAYTILPFLYFQVIEKHRQNVLRANGLGDVAEGIDSGTTNGLLVCLEHVQKLEADTHPFLGGYKLCSPVCNTPN